jgi:ferredoxin
MIRVRVDPDQCQGHLRCLGIAPAVFSADEVGHSVVEVDVTPPELEDAVQIAADNCPEMAIILTEE